MNICLKCKHAKTSVGHEMGSATDRAYCSLRLDEATNQPVACESRRFAKPGADKCGPDGLLFEPKE